jgi:hypothetical protein
MTRTELAERPRQLAQRCVHHRPDDPQRMIGRHPPRQVDVREQLSGPSVRPAHPHLLTSGVDRQRITPQAIWPEAFSSTC